MSLVLIPLDQRMKTIDRLFGQYFASKLEPLVYQMAGQLCTDYQGGCWLFYRLNDTAFLMCPDTDKRFNVKGYNDFRGQVTAKAFGIIVCLHTFNYLSFDDEHPSGPVCGEMFWQLRRFARNHSESSAIMAAIDW